MKKILLTGIVSVSVLFAWFLECSNSPVSISQRIGDNTVASVSETGAKQIATTTASGNYGNVFVITTNGVIEYLNRSGNWVVFPNNPPGTPTRIAVGSNQYPGVIVNGTLYKWTGSTWQNMLGGCSELAIVSIYGTDYIWAISGITLYEMYNGQTTTYPTPKIPIKIAVESQTGIPWIVGNDNTIWRGTGSYNSWVQTGGKATQICSGGPNSDVFMIGTALVPNSTNYYTYRYAGNNTWAYAILLWGTQVAVDNNGAEWVITSNGQVWKFNQL
jgi:hypothetical protein